MRGVIKVPFYAFVLVLAYFIVPPVIQTAWERFWPKGEQ